MREISLQVPPDINLAELSNEELEKLALDMSRKAASGLPKNSSLLGINRLNLTNSARMGIDIGILIGWSRSCDRTDLGHDVIIDPEVFRQPIPAEVLTKQKSVKAVLTTKKRSRASVARKKERKK
ncbi:hypothetical protein [Archangium violaceum]|uniref:Uncharacterized protein n=1 Tax=Archangium violaceum Cb vi76 TaxID=1406225 RepID=A0A084SNW7_9BACT|nr:hypothetical protein [Archangium violaceum]KFA90152.1 hypothetical protein Q664_29700 [Archangium violaceum Cb vi76]